MFANQYGPRIKKGYGIEYLTSLAQNGFKETVRKLSIEGETEQLLVRIALEEDQITGLWFH